MTDDEAREDGMGECKHDIDVYGQCNNCGMGAIFIISFQIAEIDRLKGEVERLTEERDEANQAYHDLANEAQFAFAGYKLKRDNLKSRLSDAMEVVEGGRHFRATGQPDLLYDALAKLDGKVE